MPGSDAVHQGVVAFATILGSIALLAGAATLCEALPAIDQPAEASDNAGLPGAAATAVVGQAPALTSPALAGWLLLFHLALKKLPPVQEALGLRQVCCNASAAGLPAATDALHTPFETPAPLAQDNRPPAS